MDNDLPDHGKQDFYIPVNQTSKSGFGIVADCIQTVGRRRTLVGSAAARRDVAVQLEIQKVGCQKSLALGLNPILTFLQPRHLASLFH